MSPFAGPHGEAACRFCNTLQDLTEERRLVAHNDHARRCVGSGTYGHTQNRELEELTFSSEPVIHHCPVCDRSIPVRTVGNSPGGYRLEAHYRQNGKPHTGYCEGTGHLLSQLKEVAAMVKAEKKAWTDTGGYLNS